MGAIKYIAFEGVDGAGKSAQIARLSIWLTRRCYTPIKLGEPSYGHYGLEVRRHLLEEGALSRDEQIRLFTLDRQEHVKKKIGPLLEFVERHPFFVVVQDRYYLSAPAYQADGEAAIVELLRSQQAIAPKPDIVFLVDVPVKLAIERIAKSGKKPTFFERREVLEKVRRNYLFLAEEGSERIVVVDATAPAEDVFARITETLSKEIGVG